MTEEAGSLQVPKKLKRTMKKLAEAGEELVQIAPAILQSQATDQMMAIARLGMMDKIIGLSSNYKDECALRSAGPGLGQGSDGAFREDRWRGVCG